MESSACGKGLVRHYMDGVNFAELGSLVMEKNGYGTSGISGNSIAQR